MPNPAVGDSHPADNERQIAQRVAKLSAGQLGCLGLVKEHLSSKEIAAKLGISEENVKKRLAEAKLVLRPRLAHWIVQSGNTWRLANEPQ